MPPSTRPNAQLTPIPQTLHSSDFEVQSDEDALVTEAHELEEDEEELDDAAMEDLEAEEEDDEQDTDPHPATTLPPHSSALREISNLASWTVSTSKPGCGVSALRNPSTNQFWQSDGPQPHTISLHFFKLVHIVALRIYLDFEADESYTPTRIQFYAGFGPHDLIDWAEMRFEQPKGWIDVDFEGVGDVKEPAEGEEEEFVDDEEKARRYWERRPSLRCFLLQVRVLENHQNGKDTHVRGLQVYAMDKKERSKRTEGKAVEKVKVQTSAGAEKGGRKKRKPLVDLEEPAWLAEPVFR
ncbi:MAG: anaphase promoting complex subunit doc1 [Bogoriella megaspora]|nr:MAG: anaphase promoting complex subunit doc1 [Bogoriella megaspora]